MTEEKVKVLHVFSNDTTDWVVAQNPEDAARVWEETVGEPYIGNDYGGDFIQLPDEDEFTLYEEETIDQPAIPEGAVLIERGQYSFKYRATHRAWADARGRCFLGSSEY